MPRRRLPSGWLTRCGGTPDGHCSPHLILMWGVIVVLPRRECLAATNMCPSLLMSAGVRSLRQRSGCRKQCGCRLAGMERRRCPGAAICLYDAGRAAPGPE